MAETSVILSGIQMLRSLGFFDFLLPFLLFFSIIYAILAKSRIFQSGDQERRDINAIVAFVIAMIATTTSWVLLALNQFLPWIGFIIVVILGFLILASMMYGGDVTEMFRDPANKVFLYVAVGLAAFVVLLVMYYALGWQKFLDLLNFSNVDYALAILGILAVIVIIAIIKSGGGGSKKKSGSSE